MAQEHPEVDVVSKFHLTPRARFVDWSGEVSSLSKITPWTLDSASSGRLKDVVGEEDGNSTTSPTAVTSQQMLEQDKLFHRGSLRGGGRVDVVPIVLEEFERLKQVYDSSNNTTINEETKEGTNATSPTAVTSPKVFTEGEDYHYSETIATAYSKISDVLGTVQSQHQSIELYEDALEMQSRIGDSVDTEEDAATIMMMMNPQHRLEPNNASLETHQDALKIAIQIHGKDHPLVALRYQRLGNILHQQHGQLTQAIEMFQQAFVIRLNTLGKDYLNVCTAILYCYMGDILMMMQQQPQSKEHATTTYQKALEIFAPILPSKDRWLGTIYRKLGECWDMQANREPAVAMYQEALHLELQKVGPHASPQELQEAAILCKRIGMVLRKQGQYDFSMKLLEEALRIKFSIQPLDPPRRFQTKLQLYQEYWQFCTRKNGRWHPSVAMVCIRMGHLWHAHANYQKAIEMYQRGLAIRLQFFGQDHLDTAVLSNTLADVLSKVGRWNEAIKYYKKSLDTFSAALGPYDPWVRSTYTKMENIFIDQDKHDQAFMMHKEVFRYELQETRYIATSKLFWGTNDDDDEEEDFCTKLYKNMLEMRATALSPEYPDSARLYNALGDLLFGQHKWEQAAKMYQEAHVIETARLGEDHPDIAVTSSILENILKHRENEEEAVEAYHKVLGIGLQAHVHDHPLIAARYHRIGNVLTNQGRYKDAMNLYQEALEIRLSKLGYDHPDTTILYNHMGHALANQGSYLEGTRMFKRALQIWKKSMGEDHPMVLSIYQKMVDMLFEQRRVAEAEELYKEKIEPFRKAGSHTRR